MKNLLPSKAWQMYWPHSDNGMANSQWELVHLARALAAVLSGCYDIGEHEAALASTPPAERNLSAWLPTDPIYEQFDIPLFERALTEAWAEPARRFPYFGRLGAT